MDTSKKNPPSSKECVFEVHNFNEVLKPNGFGESSGLQSIQTNSLESGRVALGSGVPVATFANYQRPVQGRHSLQAIPQQNQDQFINLKNHQQQHSVQNSSQSTLRVSPHKVLGQSQGTFLNPTPMATQWFLPVEHQQQLIGGKPDSIDRQANLLPGKQHNTADLEKQKRFLNQNNMCQNFQQHSQGNNPINHSSTLPQQLCQRSNVSGLQEHQKSLGMRWGSSSSQNVFLGLGQKQQTFSASLLTQLPPSQPQPPEHVSMSQSQLTKLQHLSSPSVEDTQMKFLTSGPLNQVYEGRQIIGNNLKELVYQKATSLRRKHLSKLTELRKRLDPILCELANIGRPTRLLDKVSALMQIIEKAQFTLNVPSNITPEYVQILNSLERNIECIYNSYSALMNSLIQMQLSPNVHSVQQSLQPQSQSPHIQHMQYKRQVLHPQHAEVFEMPQRNMTEVNDMKESSGICSKIAQHQTNEVKEPKIRQSMGAESFLHHRLEGQRSEFHDQPLNSGVSSSIASEKVYQSASSQIPNHSSQLAEINNPARTGISFCSANSPSFASCSLKPLSPLLGDSARKSIHDVSFMNAGSVECKQKINSLETASPCAASSPGISPSPLLTEFNHVAENCPDASLMTTDNLNVAEQPLQHLVRLVNSISHKALSVSVHDIQAIVSITDRMSDSVPITMSKRKVGQDLAAMARSCIYDAKTWTIKRKIDALSLSADSSAGSCIRINEFRQINGMDKSELESSAINCTKRPRIEANRMLNEEIREINQRLIDTVVDITNEDTSLIETAATSKFNEGTIVKCSFSAVAISPNLKSVETSVLMTLIKPLRLLVPANYPACSPILLDKILAEMSEEDGDLSVRVQSKLNRSLRSFPQPMSLLEIARTWGKCARAVICEYAEQHGGGSFSSKHGPWENCLTAGQTEK